MNWISRRICEIAEVTVSFVMSVCLSTWNNSAPSGEIYMKFDISLFFKKNIDDHFHGIFMNIAVIRFDSHICIWLERSIQNRSAFICILNVLGVITNWFQQFSCLLLLQEWQSASFCQSVSQSVIQLLEYVKLSAPSNVTANLMALSLWRAFLYVAVLNKISSSSCNGGHFMYFVICKIDHIEQNTSRYYPRTPELCLNCSLLCMKPCDMNCQPYHLTVITFLDICSAYDLSFTFCLTVPLPHIVHPL